MAVWIAAILIAPAAALPGVLLASWLTVGGAGPADFFTLLACFLVGPFTGAGLIAYGIAFLPCMVAGTTMMACAAAWPFARNYLVWAATGAALGALIALFLFSLSGMFVTECVAAGTGCALAFRAIIGFALPTVEQANPPPEAA